MHGPAPPNKHKESARFMQPLLGEVVSTIKSHAPASAASSSQSPESAGLAKAKRKLQEVGIALTPEKKPRAAQNSPSSTGPSLPTKGTKTPAEESLEKELTTPPLRFPAPPAMKQWRNGSRNIRPNFVAKPVLLRNTLQIYAPCFKILKPPSKTWPKRP